jgi:hypothetical protein
LLHSFDIQDGQARSHARDFVFDGCCDQFRRNERANVQNAFRCEVLRGGT